MWLEQYDDKSYDGAFQSKAIVCGSIGQPQERQHIKQRVCYNTDMTQKPPKLKGKNLSLQTLTVHLQSQNKEEERKERKGRKGKEGKELKGRRKKGQRIACALHCFEEGDWVETRVEAASKLGRLGIPILWLNEWVWWSELCVCAKECASHWHPRDQMSNQASHHGKSGTASSCGSTAL